MVYIKNRILKPFLILCEGRDVENFMICYLESDALSYDPRFSNDIQTFNFNGIDDLEVAKFKAKTQMTVELMIEFDEEGDPIDTDFGEYIDYPYEVELGQKELINEIYENKIPSDAED